MTTTDAELAGEADGERLTSSGSETARAEPQPASVGQTLRSRPDLVIAWLVAGAATALALAALDQLLRVSGKTIDWTDEGMYLLSADAQSREATFHNAFGRYTGILFRLVGDDIARFRALGEIVLVIAAAGFGDRVAVASARLRGAYAPVPIRIAVAAGMVSAALHYYLLLLTTPSYNWLNLLGILVTLTGFLDVVTRPQPDPRGWVRWIGPVTIAVGTAIATMGKVSSGPALFVLCVVAILAVGCSPVAERWRAIARTGGALAVLVVLHTILVNPPWVTARQITRGQKALQILDPAHYEIDHALREVWTFFETVWNDYPSKIGLAGLFAVAAASIALWRPPWARWVVAPLAAAAIVLASVRLFDLRLWHGAGAGYYVITWVSVVLLGVGLMFLPAVIRALPRPRLQPAVTMIVCLLVLGAGAASYAFGSGNGFFGQLNGGMAPMTGAAVLVLLGVGFGRRAIPLAAFALVLVLGVGVLNVVDDAMHAPYRQPPVALQREAIRIGRHGTLQVDPSTARFVRELRAAAAAAGWKPGTPMLDLTPYSATALYVLGAKPPLTIIPSVGNYFTTQDLAAWSMDQLVEAGWDDTFRDAWLLTADAPGGIDGRVLQKLGRTYPFDYEIVGEFRHSSRSMTIALLKPIDTSEDPSEGAER